MEMLYINWKAETREITYKPGQMILVMKEPGVSTYPFLNHAIKEAAANHKYHDLANCSLEENVRQSSVHIFDPETTAEEKLSRLPDLSKCAGSLVSHMNPLYFLDSIQNGEIPKNIDTLVHTVDGLSQKEYGPCIVLAAMRPGSTTYPSKKWSFEMEHLAKNAGFVFVCIVHEISKPAWDPYDYVIRLRKEDSYE